MLACTVAFYPTLDLPENETKKLFHRFFRFVNIKSHTRSGMEKQPTTGEGGHSVDPSSNVGLERGNRAKSIIGIKERRARRAERAQKVSCTSPC